MDLQLKDRVAIVTGSSRGLGLASAKALVEQECRVTICGRTRDTLDRARDRLAEVAGHTGAVLQQAGGEGKGVPGEGDRVPTVAGEGGGGEYPLQDGFGWTNGVLRALLDKYPQD